MSEEVKISMPLIDEIELQRIDNFYNDIVDKYIKAYVREKEQVISQRLMKNLREENQELKKQLEENRLNHKQLKDLDKIENSFIKIKNQQKEFIHYLTSYIELLSNKPDLIEESEIDLLKEILNKYKEIIGVSNE